MTAQKITIAIDGFSSCGKSTLAKDLAKELGYIFIDSGAMYRGVALYALRSGAIDSNHVNTDQVIDSLPSIQLHFELDSNTQTPHLYLNGENVSEEIRTPNVSSVVSMVASIKEVREKLVEEQRKMGAQGGIVMDGRDIGSVVFPNAELKLFVTANIDTRTERRYKEMKVKGISIDRKEVEKNLTERDHLDSTREISPLTQVADAIVLDNSNLTREGQLEHSLALVRSLVSSK